MEQGRERQCRSPVTGTVVSVGAIIRRVLHVEPEVIMQTLLPRLCLPLCPHQHLRDDLLLVGVSRASILPTVCVFSRLSLSTKLRLHSEASFTTTRILLKQHMEHFHSSKINDIDSRAAFPDSITPKECVRAQARHPSPPYILSTTAQ